MTDKKYNEMPLLRWLLRAEGGVSAEGCNDCDLKPLFEKNRKKMFSNDPKDKGGATLCGVTYHTFVAATHDEEYDHFLRMSYERWANIVERHYWLPLHAQEFDSLPLALVTADFGINSGVKTAVRKLQDALNTANKLYELEFGNLLICDGVVGPKTLKVVQSMPRFIKVTVACHLTFLRRDFIRAAVASGGIDKKFEKGLIRRCEMAFLEALRYY